MQSYGDENQWHNLNCNHYEYIIHLKCWALILLQAILQIIKLFSPENSPFRTQMAVQHLATWLLFAQLLERVSLSISGVTLTLGVLLLAEILHPLRTIWCSLPSYCLLPCLLSFFYYFFCLQLFWRILHVFSAPYKFVVRR